MAILTFNKIVMDEMFMYVDKEGTEWKESNDT